MSMLPKAFNKEIKGSRTSSKYYGEAPLSGRTTINENYYQDPTPKNNYMSREFTQGIFTSELNKKAGMAQRKQIPKDLPIELQEEPELDYKNNLKVRSSKKQYEFQKQSRDQYSINHQPAFEYYGFNEKQRQQLKSQLNFVKQQIEVSLIDVVKKMMNDQTNKVRQSISDLITQTNNGFKKKEQTLYVFKTEVYSVKEELTKLTKSYQNFYQENEEKFQNLHVELSNLGGVKRSKVGEYNMDLKNSYAGLNSSLSVNMGSENPNSKLVNEVIFQLDSIKKELSENKMQIQQLNFEFNSKIVELNKDNKDKNTPSTDAVSLKFEEITKLVREMLKEDKKNTRWEERMEKIETEMFNFDLIVKSQEENIQRINSEVANQVNSQINPKIKKMEASLIELFSRTENSELQKLIKANINEDLSQKMKDIRTIRIRNCSKQEQTKLSVLSGMNQDKISYKETYLLDQENYLLDSQGNYLVQQVEGRRQRIKIQNEHLYLLQLKGIQISSAT